MNSREGGCAARPLAAASVTAECSRPDETESSSQTLPSLPPASAERSAPGDGPPLPDSLPLPHRSPPLDGFIKHYEIIRKLGEGGMGIVLLARDNKLGRLVAIKLLQDSRRATSRLLAEARVTARCRHESIVVIHEVDEADERPFMVLEYLDGRTLRDVLSAGPREAGRALPKGLALDVVMSVVRALAAAHERGVVHRDIKPENIMILGSGQVKVLDFGVAVRGSSVARSGTLPYMAPEQWLGGDIDARADLWAVGVLLYELLAGAHPLEPLTMERLEGVTDMGAPMPRLRDVRPDLAALSGVVERCLRKRKEERFGSAEELLSALDPLREGRMPMELPAPGHARADARDREHARARVPRRGARRGGGVSASGAGAHGRAHMGGRTWAGAHGRRTWAGAHERAPMCACARSQPEEGARDELERPRPAPGSLLPGERGVHIRKAGSR